MSFSDRVGGLAGTDIAIRLKGVAKGYEIYKKPSDRLMQMIRRDRQYYELLGVLDDISFEVRQGQAVGIVGRNGAGKSTLLQIIAGTLQPSAGTVEVNGRVAPLIELGAGFNPEFSGHDNLLVYGQLLGMDEAEIKRKYDDIVRFADIGSYLERPVKIYSSGMYARLAFAVAMHLDPKILIVDEILAVGDAPFQRKCMNRFYEIKESGCTILIVAHDQYLVRSLCDEALYLKAGRLAGFGPASAVTAQYEQDIEMPAVVVAQPPAAVAPEPVDNSADGAAPHSADQSLEAVHSSAKPVDNALDKLFKIVDVAFERENGSPIEVLTCGDAAALRMKFKATGPELPAAISFVFNLYRHDGVYVCGSTTLMDGLGAHAAMRAGEVTVRFPQLPLLSGRYVWRVAINDHGGLLVHSEAKGVCPFKVVDDFRSVGVVHLERTWDVRPDGPAAHARTTALGA